MPSKLFAFAKQASRRRHHHHLQSLAEWDARSWIARLTGRFVAAVATQGSAVRTRVPWPVWAAQIRNALIAQRLSALLDRWLS